MASFLPIRGRGRGMGRGSSSGNTLPWSSGSSPWSLSEATDASGPAPDQKIKTEVAEEGKPYEGTECKNVKMREKMVELAAKYSMVESDESSEEEIHNEEIISKTISQYQNTLGVDGEVSKENTMLMEVLQSGAITCLVCIDNVKRLDAIWSCKKCSCILHLHCIQKWAREGVNQKKLHHTGDLDELNQADLLWACPKCRNEYKQTECPTKYFCFCLKEENPEFDPWIVPHSCGQSCEKPLLPECGHDCLLLCHPGPCPPCPKTVSSRCYCGRKGPELKRCSNKSWSCGKPCGRRLSCGHHNCEEFCHDGECPPCPYFSKQSCICGKNQSERPCAQPVWTCEQTCLNPYACGHHLCENKCHAGECGECPRSGKRNCPCGKTISLQPCTEDVATCEDTCNKQLVCGLHRCAKRCHYGPCDSCLQVVEKTCRCGRRSKEVPCSQVFSCDFKCTKSRNCGRHPCKRKCCDGNCPPCEQVCNRNLNCRNHKCPSPCHQGLCYPCTLSTHVNCFCGASKITVPCGKEKTTKPPRCKRSCEIPSDCHHETRIPHRCHHGKCPKCKQVCAIKHDDCQHDCKELCHDRIFDEKARDLDLLRNKSKKVKEELYYYALPCPPCKEPVGKSCLGKHSIENFPCSQLKPYSCRSICGRLLTCTNHVCQKECHVVEGNSHAGEAGTNCMSCEEFCLKERPHGCNHDCSLPCHPGICPQCTVHLKLDCHCRSIQLFIKCCEYNSGDKAAKDIMLTCKARCQKIIGCGHLCAKQCHPNACSTEEDCVETKKVKCPCGRRRKEVSCAEMRAGACKVECDERCVELKEKKQKEKIQKEEEERAAEERKQMEEMEKYERKKQGRKRKQKKDRGVAEQKSFLQAHKWVIGSFILVVLIAVIAGYLW